MPCAAPTGQCCEPAPWSSPSSATNSTSSAGGSTASPRVPEGSRTTFPVSSLNVQRAVPEDTTDRVEKDLGPPDDTEDTVNMTVGSTFEVAGLGSLRIFRYNEHMFESLVTVGACASRAIAQRVTLTSRRRIA